MIVRSGRPEHGKDHRIELRHPRGFFAGPQGEIEWFVWDDETANYTKELIASIDTILFGRVTYELMAGYWPTASPPAEDQAIIDSMNTTAKIVFSRSLAKADWKNTEVVKEIDKDEILKMKQESRRNMVIYGSGSIVSALTRTDLINEYLLFVNPVVLGNGKPLFSGMQNKLDLKLLGTRTFPCGVVLLRYQRVTRD